MKIWATITVKNKITKDHVIDFDSIVNPEAIDWVYMVGEACQKLNIERPVILRKHLNELDEFSSTFFIKDDFMDQTNFDKFGIEVLREKKDKQ